MSNINDVLKKLHDLNEQNTIELYVPSLKEKVKFRPLSVKQQKDLIITPLDGLAAGITFPNAITDIIEANKQTQKQLHVIDRTFILINLRIQSMGSQFSSTDSDDKQIKWNLNDFVDEKRWIFNKPLSDKIQYHGLTVKLRVPTLETDKKVGSYMLPSIKKDNKSVANSIGNMFLHEIVKFVESIAVGDHVVEFEKTPIDQAIEVVESLPVDLNRQILEYIEYFRKVEKEALTINGNELPIDAQLFVKQ